MNSQNPPPASRPARRYLFSWGFAIGAGLAGIAAAALWPQPLPPASHAVLCVGDGTGWMGQEILAAAGVLSKGREVRIEFLVPGSRPASVVTSHQQEWANLCVSMDLPSLRLIGEKAIMQDQALTPDAIREKLFEYAEAATMTDSVGLLVLSCDKKTKGEDLVHVLGQIAETRVIRIILPDYQWIFEPSPPPTLPPLQKKFLPSAPMEFDFDNTFRTP